MCMYIFYIYTHTPSPPAESGRACGKTAALLSLHSLSLTHIYTTFFFFFSSPQKLKSMTQNSYKCTLTSRVKMLIMWCRLMQNRFFSSPGLTGPSPAVLLSSLLSLQGVSLNKNERSHHHLSASWHPVYNPGKTCIIIKKNNNNREKIILQRKEKKKPNTTTTTDGNKLHIQHGLLLK